MDFPVCLFVVFLSFPLFSCERCSEALYETFKKGFNFSTACDDCVIFKTKVIFSESEWSGFCTRNLFLFIKDWKCEQNNGDKTFAVANNEFCKLAVANLDLDRGCFGKFNAETCKTVSEFYLKKRDARKKVFGKRNKVDVPIDVADRSYTAPFLRSQDIFGKRPTVSTETPLTKTTPKVTSTVMTSTELRSSDVTINKPISTSTGTSTTASTRASESTVTSTTTSTSPSSFTPETTSTSPSSFTPETTSTSPSSFTPETTSTSPSSFTPETTSTSPSSFTPETTSTSPSSFKPTTSSTITTNSHLPVSKTCEQNEFFFKDHCYFIKSYLYYHDLQHKLNIDAKLSKGRNNYSDIINSGVSCQTRHPKALGLAVETKEENKFILSILKAFHFYERIIILTSGVRNGSSDEWLDWNLKINQSVLDLAESNPQSNRSIYCVQPCKSRWYLLSPDSLQANSFIICERPYNPKNIRLDLHEQCLGLYRKSPCYNLKKHSYYCCAKDETGEIWFACPGQTLKKVYSNHLECKWTCKKEGFFIQDRPICTGRNICKDLYNNISYAAPATRYAVSGCPWPLLGHSVWYCGSNRTFLGKPDYSLCCKDTKLQCGDTDAFLNIWMGCPSKKIVKKTACPAGSLLKEAFVEWYCQENGTFNGTTPDYSRCNVSFIKCAEKDRFGVEWMAESDTTEKKDCPHPFSGSCYWKCEKSGKFEGSEPDCSKCKAPWMEEVADKIKNQSNHEEIMEIMENYTRREDLRLGYGHVLNLTSECVTLFKRQTSKGQISTFDKFLKSYSSILKNVAGNPSVWSSFSAPNRGEYVKQVLETTQNAAFANLGYESASHEKYNATFAKSEVDGFDFFVAYNFSLGSRFPLENSTESEWRLDVREINENGNSTFAAMGLVMSYSLSSIMFPQGNETKDLELNAPAITFTVARSRSGRVAVNPNVVVNVFFKHKNKTRLPQTTVIKRRLHAGEQPSGIFNSTLCHYYRNSDWSTDGCTVTFTSRDQTNCTCTHLSTIALLMSIHQYKPNRTLEIVSLVSSGISIVSLIFVLLIFFFLDTVKNDRILIGKNLCYCLLMGHIMLITVMDKRFFNISDNACTFYSIILHYVFLAAFAWMFVEGCHLYRMLVLVFDSDIKYRWIYLLIGYGVPLVVVGGTELVGFSLHEQPYGQDELCWLKPPNYVWAFVGPAVLMTSVNFFILIIAMKLAIASKRKTEKSNFATLMLWMKGWISLSTLLGITWLLGLAHIDYDEMFSYTFVVLNGLQGFFIFVFRCVLSDPYKTFFLKKIRCLFSKCKSTEPKKLGTGSKSDTKLFVINATKSLTETKDSGCESGTDFLEDHANSQSAINKFISKESKTDKKVKENFSGIDIDVNIILAPAMSEAYLRNRMISKNFTARKSKATWLGDSDNFPELSYRNIFHPK